MSMGTQKLVYVLGTALLLALVAIAFLLGRESKSPAPMDPSPASAEETLQQPGQPLGPQATAPAAEPEAATGTQAGDLSIERREGEILLTNNMPREGSVTQREGQIFIQGEGKPEDKQPEEEPEEQDPGMQAGDDPSPTQKSRERDGIQDYFNTMDTLQGGPMGVSPRKFADGLLQGAAKGDLSEFENLIDDVKRLRKKALAIVPPEPCRDLHKTTLGLMEDSLKILKDMRDALRSNDMDRLVTIAQHAQSLQKQSQRHSNRQEEFKRRYKVF